MATLVAVKVRRPRAIALAVVACILVAGALTARNVFRPQAGSPGWTGAAVTVPYCPVDAEGCRVAVTDASGRDVAHEDWSGAPTTLRIGLSAGTYGILAEGCTGYRIDSGQISVTSGFHALVGLGLQWQMPGFPGRACPGFS
jgi:ABC-type dipeptide/oligopeptide/nickel transport system permease subunit